MLTIHATGKWPRGAIRIRRVPARRAVVSDVEAVIESTWRAGARDKHIQLFDGPMCRLESWRATPEEIALELSATSYRIFYGTNLMNPQLAERYGSDVFANPVGVSAAVASSDGYLLFGRRNATVAYYPNRIHPFAGALEPRDCGDLFAAAERELREETGLLPEEIARIECVGLVEDSAIRQPEFIFHTRAQLSRTQIEARIEADEHHGALAVEMTRTDIEKAMNDESFTPVGVVTLLLVGREKLGEQWFAESLAARSNTLFTE